MKGLSSRHLPAVLLCACLAASCQNSPNGGPPVDDSETDDTQSDDDVPASDPSKPEPQGEESYFFVEIEQLDNFPYLSSGQLSPNATDDPRVLEFEFDAPRDGRLSLALSMDPPDGSFLGFDAEGLALYDDEGQPLDGEFTGEWRWMKLLEDPDAGTPIVVDHGGSGADLASLKLAALGKNHFRATVTSTGPDAASKIGAGVFAVHRGPRGLFEMEAPAGDDLFELVQHGTSDGLSNALADASNFSSPLAPGIYVIHSQGEPAFTKGQPDRGEGLEQLAEDGNPDPLFEALTQKMDGVELFPNASSKYGEEDSRKVATQSFFVVARPGDRISMFAMLGQSNDLFLGAGPKGIPLFEDDEPVDGDFTQALRIWDAGTEVNQRPGFGSFQAPRQPMPGAGDKESEPVREVDDGFSYPPIDQLYRLTISVRG